MQYLKAQTQQPANVVHKEIIYNYSSDYHAVEDVINHYIDPNMTFAEFMTSFRLALIEKEPTGLYGFKGEDFSSVNTPYYSGGALSLRGGGAVVISTTQDFEDTNPGDQGADIKYVGIMP